MQYTLAEICIELYESSVNAHVKVLWAQELSVVWTQIYIYIRM
jgi:hypothetical protein